MTSQIIVDEITTPEGASFVKASTDAVTGVVGLVGIAAKSLTDADRTGGDVLRADVVVYGATPSGIMAAISAAKSGVSVLLISTNGRVGGVVTGGLSRTDYRGYGPRVAMNVMTSEFYRRCAAVYGKSLGEFGMDGTNPFSTEPKVADAVYRDMLSEYMIPVLRNYRVTTANKQAGDIKYLDLESTSDAAIVKRIHGSIFVDASYECDLLIRSGVTYTYGREANATYSETYNGVRVTAALTGSPNAYVISGDAGSGLLPNIDATTPETAGTADSRIQAYCHRLLMTNVPANRIPIPEPTTYHADWYEALGRGMASAPTSLDGLDDLFYRAAVPQGGTEKQDWNNQGAMSLDFVGGNVGFVTTDYAARDAIVQNHIDYTLGLFKFLREDSRVPVALKTALANWGFCADEFLADGTNGMSPELYIRESARMVGDYVMTEANFNKSAVSTYPVAYSTYTMDSHIASKRVVGGIVHLEGGMPSVIVPVGSYGIEYRAMLPKAKECGNLIVSCNGISASHSAFGSIRMEVTFSSLGEAAGAAAALAIKGKSRLHDISGADLRPLVRPYIVDPARVLTINAPSTNGAATLSSVPPSGWVYATFPPEFADVRLVNEGNGNKGGRWAKFVPTFAAAGRYRIMLNAPGGTNSQLRCKVEVQYSAGAGAIDTFYIDHKFGEWQFRDLGVWDFLNDGSCFIRVTNAGDPAVVGSENGLLNIDGIAWHPVP